MDFLFGKGALDKAAGTSSPAPAPMSSDASGLQLAAQAQKQAQIARGGNDAGLGARGVAPVAHGNDAALKARVKPMPTVKPQGNDVGLGNDD